MQRRLKTRRLSEAAEPWYQDYKEAVEEQIAEMQDAANGIAEAELPDGVEYISITFGKVTHYGTPGSYTDPASVAVRIDYSLALDDDDRDLTDRQLSYKYSNARKDAVKTAVEALQDVTRLDDTIRTGAEKNLGGGSYAARATVHFWTDFDLDNWYTYMDESVRKTRRISFTESIEQNDVRTISDEIKRSVRKFLIDGGVHNAQIDLRYSDVTSSFVLTIKVPSSEANDNLWHMIAYDMESSLAKLPYVESAEWEKDYPIGAYHFYKLKINV